MVWDRMIIPYSVFKRSSGEIDDEVGFGEVGPLDPWNDPGGTERLGLWYGYTGEFF